MHYMIRARTGLAATFLVALGTVACNKKDAAPADTVAVAPSETSPLRVTDMQLGKRVGADKRIVEPTSTFATRDTVYVSVITEGAADNARLSATWTYNNSQQVSEADQAVSAAGGASASEFHISKDSAWPAGAYKVEVKLNGVSAGTREFRIQ